MKNAFTLIIVIAIGLILILGCGNKNGNSPVSNTTAVKNEPEKSVAPTVAVQAKALTKEYEDNELAADEKYKGKSLKVSGKISSIAETMGNLTVQLEGHNAVATVLCNFNESEKSNIAKLKKGQQVNLIGTGDGSTGGLYVGLNECKIE